MRKEHVYQIGDIVNDSLVIINQTRTKRNNQNIKTYEVQSLMYPDAPTYTVRERDLNDGMKDGYAANRRIYEGNSLYSVEKVRPYLVDVEQAKTIAPKSRKKIDFKCPECNQQKNMRVSSVSDYGFACQICKVGISYPELFMMAYFKVKKIKYHHQKIFNDFKEGIFDFYIEGIGVIEAHGAQHYDKNSSWYKNTKASDEKKRTYCKKNNLNLIELDCRISDFSFIKNKVKENTLLENILDFEEEQMLSIIEKNKKYPVKDIVNYYKKEKNVAKTSEYYGLSKCVVRDILRKNNIKDTDCKRKVKCITTDKVFNSIAEAGRYYSINGSSISHCLKGRYEYAGKLNDIPLQWEYVNVKN